LPALDLKTHGELSVEELTEWVKAWLARVEERLGVKPMIYAPTALWVQWMGDSTWFAENGYRFWVRDWVNATPTVPANNWGGHGWTLWQYGKAPVAGFSGKVDVNRFNGTILAPLRIKNNR
jgi:GH25 family lysozyme M1 (1,4-beta-N-acetylmuramidase)